VQWRAKAKIVNRDERLAGRGRGHCHTLHLRRRPDTQALAFSAETPGKRHVKAVELNAGVELPLESRNNLCANDWFGIAKDD
jgi:hypothetical protein